MLYNTAKPGMKYKVRVTYQGLSQYNLFVYDENGKYVDVSCSWCYEDLIKLIHWSDEFGLVRADDWLDDETVSSKLREYIEKTLGEENTK